MNKLVYNCIILMCLSSCVQNDTTIDAYLLTYVSQVEFLDDSKPINVQNYILQKYGDSVEVIYDNKGNVRMDYFGTGLRGMSYSFYNANKHINYAKWKNLDTIYYYDASINELILDSTSRIETENGFMIKYYSHNPNNKDNIVQEFYFLNDSLIANGFLYSNFKDFFFGDILSEAQRLPIKTVVIVEDNKITKSLIRTKYIEDPSISLFELDSNTPSIKH